MKVIKFGGTSIGSVENMNRVKEIIDTEETKIVVLSAMSGTTNFLVDIIEDLKKKNKVSEKVNLLHGKYKTVVNELLSNKELQEKSLQRISDVFNYIESICMNLENEPIYDKKIIAQGEILSTYLFHQLLNENQIDNCLLSSLDFIYKDMNGEPDIKRIKIELQKILSQNENKITITQGFICRDFQGKIDNLDRGGSDYTASIIGAAIDAEEIQIWTDIDGFHNNDPRVVNDTNPIHQLSFDEAAELAYFGAKILHPQSVLPAKEANIPVRLKKTTDPKAKGTIIMKDSPKDGIKAVAAKDGITAVRIRSARMLLAYGFLENVFGIFSKYKTPIDMITTSEIAISLTIDNTKNIEDIVNELNEFSTVEVENNLSIICVVGQKVVEDKSTSKLFKILEKVPVRMISYGGSQNNISILVKEANKEIVLKEINTLLF